MQQENKRNKAKRNGTNEYAKQAPQIVIKLQKKVLENKQTNVFANKLIRTTMLVVIYLYTIYIYVCV